MADQPRMRGFFHYSITPKLTSSYGNFQYDKHKTIRRGQIRIIQMMFRHFQVQLLDSPIWSMGKDTVYNKSHGFYNAKVPYFLIRSAEVNFPTA